MKAILSGLDRFLSGSPQRKPLFIIRDKVFKPANMRSLENYIPSFRKYRNYYFFYDHLLGIVMSKTLLGSDAVLFVHSSGQLLKE